MKAEIHPEQYRPVIFHDNASGERFLIGSTIKTEETDRWEDGEEYPLTRVEVSSASHPFYTGAEKVLDSAGRVERFKQRAAAANPVRGAASHGAKGKRRGEKTEEKEKNG